MPPRKQTAPKKTATATKAKTPEQEAPRVTPARWEPGDPGYEPDENPSEKFFHVVALLDGRDERMALLIHDTYERGRTHDGMAGRRYLVNAKDEAEARVRVERIEQQIAANDEEHIARYGEGSPFTVGLVVHADELLHARRDPDPAELKESFHYDPVRADARRQRARQAGIE